MIPFPSRNEDARFGLCENKIEDGRVGDGKTRTESIRTYIMPSLPFQYMAMARLGGAYLPLDHLDGACLSVPVSKTGGNGSYDFRMAGSCLLSQTSVESQSVHIPDRFTVWF